MSQSVHLIEHHSPKPDRFVLVVNQHFTNRQATIQLAAIKRLAI
jgi:hypothetical protein